ncbi:hypothetical protein EVAR_67785_1 [Eumeta japonica]|uniref:CUB domain-containing protein n=1 Tax=Eumeta variegata TaxID=151549 RepID=A0A4C1ZZK3_EUMVA|nr:hypothetical protein EVAR_67785_1 [Eumeta japonica]
MKISNKFKNFTLAKWYDCGYDYLEVLEGAPGDDDWPEPQPGLHDEVSEETETLMAESDSVSAGWVREARAGGRRSRRLCGDWSGKLKLLRYTTRAQHLRLRFVSDHSAHAAGFKVKISVADCKS